jgi:transcriptional regulator with XRE-family HTH domain
MTKKGRPIKISKKEMKKAEEWAKKKYSDKEIAERLGVSARTFSDYKKKFPELKRMLDEARRPLITEAEGSLLKLVQGFCSEEEIKVFDKNGILTSTTIIKKKHPPQSRAIEMFLKRYDPKYHETIIEKRKFDLEKSKDEHKQFMDRIKILME